MPAKYEMKQMFANLKAFFLKGENGRERYLSFKLPGEDADGNGKW